MKESKRMIYIMSYNLIPALSREAHKSPNRLTFQAIIADESHYLKSQSAKRTRALVPMLQNSRRAILLSGTPALSRPIELFTQLNALDPTTWSDLKVYGKRYCRDAKATNKTSLFNSHNRFSSWASNNYKGANNMQELHVMLTGTLMIRRTKKDVLSQLPEKIRFVQRVEIKDTELKEELSSLVQKLAEYEELLAKRKNQSQDRDSDKRRKADQSIAYLTESGLSSMDEPENPNEKLIQVRKSKKNALMMMFNKSGMAKLPAILEHLGAFLANPLSGKVSKLTSYSHLHSANLLLISS